MKSAGFLVLSAFFVISSSQPPVKWHQKKVYHETSQLSNEQLSTISGYSDAKLFNDTLDHILIPRVPGTRGHKLVSEYIVKTMESLQWEVTLDSFKEQTPLGTLKFSNIIATLDPKAERHLVLACHYDSKLNREKTLLVATDSAVPCTMIINIAQLLAGPLKHRTEHSDVTLRAIFFDGEEALVQWTATDSLYGARHLANQMHQELYPLNNRDGTSHLDRMDVMVLLDLLGAKDPLFRSYFPETKNLYNELATLEQRLHDLGLLSRHTGPYFTEGWAFQGVEDDHVPFMNKGVRILHLIPSPFPNVWHKESDNRENLDFTTIENLNRILRSFVAKYLHLRIERPL